MKLILSISTGAPVYLSFPHFYKADPNLLDAVEGLNPRREIHETYFKIQPVSVISNNNKNGDNKYIVCLYDG